MTDSPDLQSQRHLINGLCDPARNGSAEPVRLVETHISYVLLTGSHAYKIKKAVRMGFLDFTTLKSRRFYCEQELRLNRRLAPALYLDVVTITGPSDQPRIGGPGPVLDYAVRMHEFPQDALLSQVLGRNALTTRHIDQLAGAIAAFHGQAPVAAADGPYGVPEHIERMALANFADPRGLLTEGGDRAQFDRLDDWTRQEQLRQYDTFMARRRNGFVRECHGDLHLNNIALIDGAITLFDCIEFNDQMRWIDVMSDIAFTNMDLLHGNRPDYAHRFLNAYLERCGDYAGLPVLNFYRVFRAMVRAKVACLRAAQLPAATTDASRWDESRRYLDLATQLAATGHPAIVITHGFAGCGKSAVSQVLIEQFGALRIRTDVERKRMHGLGARDSSRSGIAGDLYAPGVSRSVYQQVATLAGAVLDSGRVVIVDAAFLRRWQRDAFRALARERGLAFVILDIRTQESTLRDRLQARSMRADDASEAGHAVLDYQLRTDEPLADDEQRDVIRYDGDRPLADARIPATWQALRDELGGARPRQGR